MPPQKQKRPGKISRACKTKKPRVAWCPPGASYKLIKVIKRYTGWTLLKKKKRPKININCDLLLSVFICRCIFIYKNLN